MKVKNIVKMDVSKTVREAYARAKGNIKGRLDGSYQHDGVKWMLQREYDDTNLGYKGGILADDMGLGKTMQTIATMRGNETSTLIISIVGTINQWRDALIDFGGYKPIIINPSFSGILPLNKDVVVTSYTAFQKKTPIECLYKEKWGRIILDEGHMIRNPKTKINIEISKLRADIKWILSGTPIQNGEKDIMALASWIGCGDMSVEEICNALILRRTQEEQSKISPRLALPPLNTNVIKLHFATKAEQRFYEDVETYFAEKAIGHGAEAMTSLTRCRQACTNPELYNLSIKDRNKKRKYGEQYSGKTPTWNHGNIVSTKVNYIVDDIQKNQSKQKNGKCLIFCIWTEEMKFLVSALKEKNIPALIYDGGLSRDNKEAVLYNFKNTAIPVLILQINCGSTGLNLQCANRVYITSPNWNPCVELQAIGRAYRKGQIDCVTCIRLVMVDTVEERCMEIQKNKLNIITDAMMDNSLQCRLGGYESLDDVSISDIFLRKNRAVENYKRSSQLCDDDRFPDDKDAISTGDGDQVILEQPLQSDVPYNEVDDFVTKYLNELEVPTDLLIIDDMNLDICAEHIFNDLFPNEAATT